ncbi:hypothetical protein [Candidatus Contubernalis alkaliaceticus]|uniref:hypothetical protein n=1 Tax=Candidatus Contubernalis alkaliaceticus TaxID=338645 RepID=UPI001F4BEBAF|nr:hypothetical protein [Candidatus Contubernalis alkalaceticus]UNC91335.1 hypothetical protein HUE98_04060 [Candidatus Contubernalis alkalaceticus]
MKPFKEKRTIWSYSLSFNAAPDVVFPLLCPVRELEWIPGWEYEMIYSNSGLIEEGCIFTTDEYVEGTVWYVAEYDQANHKILFIQYANDLMIVRFAVALNKDEDGNTKARVDYTFTALTEKGSEYIDSISEDEFTFEVESMEELLNHYIKTGRMMKV